MFGQLGAAGADHAVVGYRDEIRHPAVIERVAIQRRQRGAVQQLLDVQRAGVRLQIGLWRRRSWPAADPAAARSAPASSQISKPWVPKPGVLWNGVSDWMTRSFGSIGDWPCLALTMISVEPSIPCLTSSASNLPSAVIDELELQRQRIAGRGVAVEIAAGQAGVVAVSGLGQLLADADGLEVHPEDRRHAGMGGLRCC